MGIQKFKERLLLGLPEEVTDFFDGDFDLKPGEKSYELIICFVFTLEEMKERVADIMAGGLLADRGYLYFAYPKKGNKAYEAYIERDSIFPALKVDEADGFIEGTPFKFSKMVSLNDVFTIVGVKRFDKKPGRGSISSRVEDYVDKIPLLREALGSEALTIYDRLTPGYQRDWARYVYRVKSDDKRREHLEDMEHILKEGYKSKDLYRRGIK